MMHKDKEAISFAIRHIPEGFDFSRGLKLRFRHKSIDTESTIEFVDGDVLLSRIKIHSIYSKLINVAHARNVFKQYLLINKNNANICHAEFYSVKYIRYVTPLKDTDYNFDMVITEVSGKAIMDFMMML